MSDPRQNLPTELRTVKSKLIDAIIDALRAAPFRTPHVVYGGSNPKLFEYVEFGVLDDILQVETPAARCELGDEQMTELTYPVSDKTFRFYVHFKVIRMIGVDPAHMIQYYFGRITETLVMANHFAGIALDISEVGNAPQAQGKNDPEPGGSIWFDIDLRHGYGNYFSEIGNG